MATTMVSLCKVLSSCSGAWSRGSFILWGRIYRMKRKKGKTGIRYAYSAGLSSQKKKKKVKKELKAG